MAGVLEVNDVTPPSMFYEFLANPSDRARPPIEYPLDEPPALVTRQSAPKFK